LSRTPQHFLASKLEFLTWWNSSHLENILNFVAISTIEVRQMNSFERFDRDSFTTELLGNGTSYRLPYRKLSRLRQFGWAIVGFGMFTTLFMVAWMWTPIAGGLADLQRNGGIGWVSIGFGCLGLFGLVPAVGLFLGGVAVIRNKTRCDIEVCGGNIVVRERFFLFWLKRQRAVADIEQLCITAASDLARDRDGRTSQIRDAGIWLGDHDTALTAKMKDGSQFPVAVGYPSELLQRLGEELSRQVEADISVALPTIRRNPEERTEHVHDRPTIRLVEASETGDEVEASVVPDQPINSKAIIERRPFGMTIEIPPAGVWKGSHGLMFMAVLWNGFVSFAVMMAVLVMAGVLEGEGDAEPWVMGLALVPFVAVGIWMLLTAINMGRRHASIATADDMIMIVHHSIFGKTTREWKADEIDEIRCGHSGMEVNDVPVNELQIIPFTENKFGCLSQLENDELGWIAAELNHALKMHLRADRNQRRQAHLPRDESGCVIPAQNSRLTVQRSASGVQINVPPLGFIQGVGLIVFGLVFASAGIGIAIAVAWSDLKNGFQFVGVGELLFGSVFLLGFGGAGSCIFWHGIVTWRRRFTLTTDYDELTMIRRGPIGHKTFRWKREELESVEVTDSGAQVNHRTLYQVCIRCRNGQSIGIMTGHARTDLDVVAFAVTESLGLAKKVAATAEPALYE
jgi:hypothetical protein